MKEYSLDPVVMEKIGRFSRRRKALILWRGICGALAVWFATMITLALVDRFIVIPDIVRLVLSVTGYVATAVVFWVESGRHLVHLPGPREIARLIEVAAPQLREELLAAVELAETSRQPHWDSDEFREAVQKVVASRVMRIEVEELLTGKMISTWLYSALIALALFLVLLVVPGLRFPQFFMRAALAIANMERPSECRKAIPCRSP